jgi:hypothetical protein
LSQAYSKEVHVNILSLTWHPCLVKIVCSNRARCKFGCRHVSPVVLGNVLITLFSWLVLDWVFQLGTTLCIVAARATGWA